MDYQETSRAAWESFIPVSRELDRAIMGALSRAGIMGMICQDIEVSIGRDHQAVSGNLRHLFEAGFVEKTGEFGTTRSGRRAACYRIAMRPGEVEAPAPRRKVRGRAFKVDGTARSNLSWMIAEGDPLVIFAESMQVEVGPGGQRSYSIGFPALIVCNGIVKNPEAFAQRVAEILTAEKSIG